MGIISKCAIAATVAAIGVGAASTTASAITITGGPAVSATWDAWPTFTVAGSYTVSCEGGFAGSVTGATTMSIRPSFTNCENFGFEVLMDWFGDLELNVKSGAAGYYYYEVGIPSGTVMTLSMPVVGCEVSVSGPQTIGAGMGVVGTMYNALMPAASVILDANADGIAFTTNNACPFSDDDQGTFSSNGNATIEGISITP